jgi:hypothetical protein
LNSTDRFLLALPLLGFSGSAMAYIDPGTGSLILQGLIAGAAIAWFTIRSYWRKLLVLFGVKQPLDPLADDEEISAERDKD